MKFKKLISGLVLATTLALGVGAALKSNLDRKPVEEAAAAISKTVTKVYVEDQVNASTTVLAIESISFDSGYDHTAWRAFLTSYLGARSSYNTTTGTSMPSSKGWSYMSNSEQEKYLLCPTGSKNYTMIFPEWVTAFSYKAVGNNWWNWFDVNGSAVGLHSGWGIGKKVNSYIYNDSGWKMNANLVDTAQSNTWGDITITARAIKAGTTTELASKSITMSKYYKISGQSYDLFGYTFGGWYTTNALTSEHNTLLTANTTIYAKETQKKEAYLACASNGWKANDDNYLLVPGSDSQYTITISLPADDEFKVVYNGTWYGWDNVDPASKLVTSGTLTDNGGNILLRTATTLEIYFKTTASSNRIWIQQDSQSEAEVYATAFLAAITCTQTSTTFNINVWNEVSGTASMEYKFNDLTEGAKGKLSTAVASESGNVIQQCAARYDRILGKYGYGTAEGQYHDFMNRKPAPLNRGMVLLASITNGSSGNAVAIIAISIVSVAAVGGFFFIRRKKHN